MLAMVRWVLAHPSLDTGGGMKPEPASGGHCGGKPCTPPNMALGSKPPGPPTMAPLTPGICMPGGSAKAGNGGPAQRGATLSSSWRAKAM